MLKPLHVILVLLAGFLLLGGIFFHKWRLSGGRAYALNMSENISADQFNEMVSGVRLVKEDWLVFWQITPWYYPTPIILKNSAALTALKNKHDGYYLVAKDGIVREGIYTTTEEPPRITLKRVFAKDIRLETVIFKDGYY